VDLWGPRTGAGVGRTIVDGLALALLVGVVFGLERFDFARATVERAEVDTLTPSWLVATWMVAALLGLALGIYVAARTASVASGIAAGRQAAKRWPPALVRLLAGAAVAMWTLWQVAGIGVVEGARSLPDPSVLRWTALALALATVLAGGLLVDLRSVASRASIVFVQIAALLALFALVFFVRKTADQLNDVLRAWGDGPPSRAVAGIAAALLLGALLRASADRLLVPRDRRLPLPPSIRWAVAGTSASAALLLWIAGGEAAAALAALVALAAATTTRVPPRKPARPPPGLDETSLRRFAATLGVVPLGILLIGLAGASVDSVLLPSPPSGTDIALIGWSALVLVTFGMLSARAHGPFRLPWTKLDDRVAGCAVGAIGFVVGLLVAVVPDLATIGLGVLAGLLAFKAFGEHGAHELWAAWGVVLGVGLAVSLEPVEAPRALGAFGLALFGLTGILAVLHIAASLGARRAPPIRIPLWGHVFVPGLLAVWIAVAWFTAPERAHQARTLATAEAEATTIEIEVRRWLDAEAPARGEVPMVLVGASGGGSKAAYWTALVLDCLLGEGVPSETTDDECNGSRRAPERLDHVFLISSVSGGSIGVYQTLTHLNLVEQKPWLTQTAEREVLSPLVAWGLFHDLPLFMLGAHTDPNRCDDPLECPLDADRALVQEGALSEDVPDRGLLGQRRPLTTFNGTVGWGPDRITLSPAGLAPEPMKDAIDAHDVIGAEDLRLVTAALLSARFPVLEPAGRLGGDSAVEVRDGGIVENTGLLTILQLIPAVQDTIRQWKAERPAARADVHVRLIVVSIDDDVLWPEGDENERGGFRGSGLRTAVLRKRLRGCLLGPVTYRRISPSPHVGAQAATGWETSQTSRREDLGESFRTGRTGVADAVQELRDVLDGKPRRDRCDS
jgi:hypothetical protein